MFFLAKTLQATPEGWFHPRDDYSEGGTFQFAESRPEWDVPASEIAPPAPPGSLRVSE
mgnify:CR=1 FL=1